MDVDRRSLMKGLFAGGALLAMGMPAWAFEAQSALTPKRYLLILGGTRADEAFADGACAAYTMLKYEEPQTIKLEDELFTGVDRIITLLDQCRETRMIAVMDDASAVIFLELARAAGVRLLSMGMHAFSFDSACPLRHTLATTSHAHGVGGVLASQLDDHQGGFSITEDFLHASMETAMLSGWSAPGFASYRLTESESVHLHSSGLSLMDGCKLIGRSSIEGWEPIPLQACARETVRRRSGGWVESVGFSVTASALGGGTVRESCATRAFVRRSPTGVQLNTQERFMSLVMDL